MYAIHVPLFFLIINVTIFNGEQSEIATKSSNSNDCADEVQEVPPNHETIIWNTKLTTDGHYLSTPICLDDKFNFKTRKCTEGHFEPQFDCASVQKTLSQCPLDSEEKEIVGQTVCFSINEPTKYSDRHCKYKNAAGMSNFVTYINEFTQDEVWYPGSKKQPYNIFLHDEITEDYQTMVAGVEYADNTISGKDCIKINRLGQLIAVSCDEEYKSLCIFKILADLQEQSYCRLKFKTGHFINNYDLSNARCLFNVANSNCNSANMELAEFLEPFQNLIMPFNEKINNHVTSLQYSPSLGGFYWPKSNSAIKYSYWSANVEPSGAQQVRNVPEGWSAKKWFSDKENYICQSKEVIDFGHSLVELSLDDREFQFRLGFAHLDFARVGFQVGFCFTNTARGLPIAKVDLGAGVENNNELVYTIQIPIGQYRGSYWCEGFKLPAFIDMKQEHILKKADNYVVYVTVDYFDGENPLDPQPVPWRTVELFQRNLANFPTPVDVKWSGVDTINKPLSTATYILNIWCLEEGIGESEEHLLTLEELIKNTVGNQIKWTSDVFSSYYCRPYLKSETNPYYWGKTERGSTKEVFCQNGIDKIKRNCLKDDDNDYIKGARWSEIIGACLDDCLGQKQIWNNNQEINWDTKIATDINGDLYISTPICLDENYTYLTRLKKDNCFIEEEPPECFNLQEVPFKNNNCPPDFEFNTEHNFCFEIADKVGEYPPKCRYPNNVPLAQLSADMIRSLPFADPIWYPAKRYHQYTYFSYDDYGSKYKQPVDDPYRIHYLNSEIGNKRCLVLKKTSADIFLQAVDCAEQYIHVCVYPILQKGTNSYCQLVHEDDKCYHSDYDLATSKCICPTKLGATNCTLAEFHYNYQSYETDDEFKIGLAFDGGRNKYFWASSAIDLTYSIWSNQLDPKSSEVYLSSRGWIQGSNSTFKLCQIEIASHQEKPALSLIELSDKFNLEVTNPINIARTKGAIFCFTDSGGEDIISPIEVHEIEEKEETYEFTKSSVSGNYWCEAFIYHNLENIQSNTIFVNDFNHYVFCLTISFVVGEDPTSPAFVNTFIINKLQDIFTESSMDFVLVAWSDTRTIEDLQKQATYCLNLKTNKQLDYEQDELEGLEFVLANVRFDDRFVDITGLLSSHYCRGLIGDDDYVWAQTKIGFEARFECPIGDDVLTRLCEGDFVNGGWWGGIIGKCPTVEDYDCESAPSKIYPQLVWNTKISKSTEEDPHTNYYISTPICLNEDRVPKTRVCVDSIFGEEPTCQYIQEQINRCPNNLLQHQIGGEYYCYVVKEHPLKCPFENTLPFTYESTKSLMQEVLDDPVWFPAGRNKRFTHSYLMVNEPSADYMTDANISYKSGDITKRNCAIINPFNGRIEAANCDEEYHRFCAYLALENNEFSFCSLLFGEKCYNTNFDLSKQTMCHCREQFSNNCDIAEFHLPYQNFIIPTNEQSNQIAYLIGICAKAWCSQEKFEYSFWSGNLMYTDVNPFLTHNGWQRKPTNENTTHTICKRPFFYRTPQLTISMAELKFTIELSEPHHIVRKEGFDVVCFTDAINNDLLSKITPQLETSNDFQSVYWFLNDSPDISGYYWCEAFGYPHFDLITSNVHFYDSKYNNYVVQIGTRYETNQNPLTHTFVEANVLNPLQNALSKILVATAQWMDTILLNDKQREVVYLLHITTKTRVNNVIELRFIDELVYKITSNVSLGLLLRSGVLSSRYCPSDSDLWPQTDCGQTIPAGKTCLELNGKYNQRTCEGDFTKGCRWAKPTGSCTLLNEDNSKITNDLYDLLTANISEPELVAKLTDLTCRNEEFKTIDVFLTALIFEKIPPDCITTFDSAQIVNQIMDINSKILYESQVTLNSTDKILYHFDEILLNKKPNNQKEELIQAGDVSIVLFDLKKSPVNGVSIIFKNNKLNYNFLYTNLTDLNSVNERDLILATHIPINLIPQLNGDHFFVRLSIFLKDTLFNENQRQEVRFNAGLNIGILLPKIDEKKQFINKIPVIIKPQYQIEPDLGQCAFWNYGFHHHNAQRIYGSWLGVSNKMEILQDNIRCEFDHTTHFAFLIMGSQSDFEKTVLQNSHVLLVITTIECILSILGIVGIFATAILFKTWRRNKGNQILLHLSIVTFFQFCFLYISGAIKEDYLSDETWCFGVGVVLHYTVLAQFCWMLVIAYLQYKKFVHVFKRSQSAIVFKSCIVGYLLPVIPVLYLVFEDKNSYLDKNAGICYPSGDGLTFAVLLPIGCVILINVLLFLCIIFNIFFPKSKSNRSNDDLLMLRFRLVFVLFFMLGMTWIFGILGQITRNIMFLFLFSLTASLQGFVLFMFFIVFNKRSRKLYVHYFKIKRYGI